MRCAQPAVRRGQDTRPTFLPVSGLFLQAVSYFLFAKRLLAVQHFLTKTPVLFVPQAQTPPYLLFIISYLLFAKRLLTVQRFLTYYLLSFI